MRRARASRPLDSESDDFVSIDARSDYEAQVRVTCPDKTGLGSDITRTIFDFGLVTTKGDFATDGKWAFVLVTVAKQSAIFRSRNTSHVSNGGSLDAETPVNWKLLKVRLENLCPSKQSISTLSSLNLAAFGSARPDGNPPFRAGGADASADHAGASPSCAHAPGPGMMYILQVEVEDRVGLLHDVTQELWASELTVHRAHISTSPAETAVDLFYVTDEKNELPSETRVAELTRAVQRVTGGGTDASGAKRFGRSAVSGNRLASVTLTPAPAFLDARRSDAARSFERGSIGRIETASATQYTEATVTVDTLMSEKHTVFQIRTRDRKGLLYDVLRASKDLEVKVNYAKVEMRDGGDLNRRARNAATGSGADNARDAREYLCEIDLFVGRCVNVRERRYLCQRYKENVERPVSVQIMTLGLDETTTELRVIAPLDISGFTRPRVLLDVTEALRQLKVMVFKADILVDDRSDASAIREDRGGGRFEDRGPGGRQEVHRFLLTDAKGQPISSVRDRKVICNRVLGVLLQ